MIRLGMLGTASALDVDPSGRCSVVGTSASLEVWIGAEDGWHDPQAQVSTRQRRPGVAPAIESRVRIAGGDVHVVAYGAYTHPDCFIVEITNQSPSPCVVALATESLAASIAQDAIDTPGPDLLLGRTPRDVVHAKHRNELWDALTSATNPILSDEATVGLPRAFDAMAHRALVYPVAHGAVLRVALCCTDGARSGVDLATLPGLDAIEAGWQAQLARNLRTQLPDERLQHAIDAARASLLIEHATQRATPEMMVTLEDWGFDTEAADAFAQLGFRDRRRVATRPNVAAPWSQIEMALRSMSATLVWPDGPAHFLHHVRNLLATERPDGTLDVLTHLPPTWLGQSIDITDIPTRSGRVSVAVRWHGNRPAVLWESQHRGLRLHFPGLDPVWMSDEPSGEALLAPVGV